MAVHILEFQEAIFDNQCLTTENAADAVFFLCNVCHRKEGEENRAGGIAKAGTQPGTLHHHSEELDSRQADARYDCLGAPKGTRRSNVIMKGACEFYRSFLFLYMTTSISKNKTTHAFLRVNS